MRFGADFDAPSAFGAEAGSDGPPAGVELGSAMLEGGIDECRREMRLENRVSKKVQDRGP